MDRQIQRQEVNIERLAEKSAGCICRIYPHEDNSCNQYINRKVITMLYTEVIGYIQPDAEQKDMESMQTIREIEKEGKRLHIIEMVIRIVLAIIIIVCGYSCSIMVQELSILIMSVFIGLGIIYGGVDDNE